MTPTTESLQRRIIWCVAAFLVLGHIALFSATGVIGLQRFQSEFYFVSRQALSAIVGFCLMFFLAHIRLTFLKLLATPLLLFQIVLVALTFVPHIGHSAQGAARWLHPFGFTFQPSELGKITVVLYMAMLLALNIQKPLPLRKWATRLFPIGILMALTLKQPDLGMASLFAVIVLGMLFVSGMPLRYFLVTVLIGAGGFAASLLHSPYRRRRLMAFLDPWNDPQGHGFQTIQSFLSFHSGQWFGTGIGNGNSKLFFLPDVHTDFIFALIGEEMGFVGAIFVLCLFVYFGYLLFKVSSQTVEPFGCYVAFGLALGLVMQIAVNLAGVTGLIPMKGLPLPFISWGRSALLVNLCSVGIILNVLRRATIMPKKPRTP